MTQNEYRQKATHKRSGKTIFRRGDNGWEKAHQARSFNDAKRESRRLQQAGAKLYVER